MNQSDMTKEEQAKQEAMRLAVLIAYLRRRRARRRRDCADVLGEWLFGL